MFREKNASPPPCSPPFWACVEGSKGKPAIYWPPSQRLWLFIPGIWPEAGDESFSQSATIRSTEISDVSPAACCSAPLAAHLILIFLSFCFFFSLPLRPSLPKLSDWLWVVGLAWADGGTKGSSWHWPKYLVDYSWDTHQELDDQGWHNRSVQLEGCLCCTVAPTCCSAFYF